MIRKGKPEDTEELSDPQVQLGSIDPYGFEKAIKDESAQDDTPQQSTHICLTHPSIKSSKLPSHRFNHSLPPRAHNIPRRHNPPHFYSRRASSPQPHHCRQFVPAPQPAHRRPTHHNRAPRKPSINQARASLNVPKPEPANKHIHIHININLSVNAMPKDTKKTTRVAPFIHPSIQNVYYHPSSNCVIVLAYHPCTVRQYISFDHLSRKGQTPTVPGGYGLWKIAVHGRAWPCLAVLDRPARRRSVVHGFFLLPGGYDVFAADFNRLSSIPRKFVTLDPDNKYSSSAKPVRVEEFDFTMFPVTGGYRDPQLEASGLINADGSADAEIVKTYQRAALNRLDDLERKARSQKHYHGRKSNGKAFK
ncbi:hypothetical protein CVT24_013236, partial [Panaeolus cyanescens]